MNKKLTILNDLQKSSFLLFKSSSFGNLEFGIAHSMLLHFRMSSIPFDKMSAGQTSEWVKYKLDRNGVIPNIFQHEHAPSKHCVPRWIEDSNVLSNLTERAIKEFETLASRNLLVMFQSKTIFPLAFWSIISLLAHRLLSPSLVIQCSPGEFRSHLMFICCAEILISKTFRRRDMPIFCTIFYLSTKHFLCESWHVE